MRRSARRAWLLVLGLAAAPATYGAPPAFGSQVYGTPMATIIGRGAITFRVTLGMLVDAHYQPIGIYRSYPSKSKVPLSERYTLDMLTTRDGAILASYQDIPLLVLHGHVAGRAGEYPLTLTYLTHVEPRRYASCTLHVRFDGAAAWQLLDGAGHVASQITVTSGLTGIRAVSACAAPLRHAP
ncbi:MAG TPA: hypothetical protein VFQ95_04105 [Rhodanobacteraceae bacterium]|nr:hypothetical protein [Rhodanobacteraceae bacterium]